MSFTLAIVGRPNVGKSTLFNRLVGKRLAIVDDQPGVTRDLREGQGRIGPLKFTVVDTAGLENETDDSLMARMRRLTEKAVDYADLCLFLIDGRVGLTSDDKLFASLLRKRAKHVILLVNKCEGMSGDEGFYESYSLGLGDPIRLSAEHGIGLDELMYTLKPFFTGHSKMTVEPEVNLPIFEEDINGNETSGFNLFENTLQMAVVGRPNAGKSTLINKLDSSIDIKTSPISESNLSGQHTTTFSEMYDLDFNSRIIDTPGIKGFGLYDVKNSELRDFFKEFTLLRSCKFNNCLHLEEPGCEVKDRVSKGDISKSRYDNYVELLSEINSNYRY